ncbi:MAG: helix-turn-helix transcriptional regulator [Ruminococcus sp.]|nr:helix-turn-helix transcriptional regulator [Candidatus Apopatosoma intestinale]
MIMKSFGQRLKELRKEVGVSQSYLADHIGVSAQSVSNWECDNTMPDISQIVPLASLLSVSTDYLLGVGNNESTDKAELEKAIDKIWATYSVNTIADNADLLVYKQYKEYLKKYPLDYIVKTKCAYAIKDFLYVSAVRKKFDIAESYFEELWTECDRMLRLVCENCTMPEVQMDAENCLIELLLLKNKYTEAKGIAGKLPDTFGIKDQALRRIFCAEAVFTKAYEKQNNACKIMFRDYVNALFYRAKILSDDPGCKEKDALAAWDEMTTASKSLIDLYLTPSDLAVNAYEKNPYCFLITSYTSKSNFLLQKRRIEEALICAENACNVSIEMLLWVKENCSDPQILSDVSFFAEHTPNWCWKWAGEEKSKGLLSNARFLNHVERINRHLQQNQGQID